MKPMVVAFRRLRAGVSVADYWRAVREGRRDAVLEPPSAMPVAVYQALREVERAFARAAGVDPGLSPGDVEAMRERIRAFDREWAEAQPCDDAGELLPPAIADLPLSPMARRQLKPRRRPETPKGPRMRQARSASRKEQPPGAHGCADRAQLFIADE